MAPKKKQNQLAINHDSSDCATNSEMKEKTRDKNTRCGLNGDTPPSVVNFKNGNAHEHLIGCNGMPHPQSNEGSTTTLSSSSLAGSSKIDSSSSIEVLTAALKKVELVSDSKDVCDKSDEKDQASESELSRTDLSTQIAYVQYESELQMPDIMRLIQKDLSEPYSIYTYRYFIHNWPMLCFLVR